MDMPILSRFCPCEKIIDDILMLLVILQKNFDGNGARVMLWVYTDVEHRNQNLRRIIKDKRFQKNSVQKSDG